MLSFCITFNLSSINSNLWCGIFSKAVLESKYILFTDDPSTTHFETSSKNITCLLSMTSLLETNVEMGLSSYV